MHWHKDMIRERLPFIGWSLFLFKMSPGMRPRKDWGLINLYIENICYTKVFEDGWAIMMNENSCEKVKFGL